MPRFRYRALRPVGGEVAGELVADDAGAAASQLQSAGSFPIEIAPVSGASFACPPSPDSGAWRSASSSSSRASSPRCSPPAWRSTARWG